MTTRRPNLAPAKQVPAPLVDPLLELDRALGNLISEHEQLLQLARLHREAIANADVSAMHRCLEAQESHLQRVREHESRRQAAIRAIQGDFGTAASTSRTALAKNAGKPAPQSADIAAESPSRLSIIAQRASEPVRSRLISLGERLRDLLNALHLEHRAIHQAAETLSSHMEGLMRQICRHLSHAGTYGRTAAIDTSTPVVTVLDLRS